MSSRNKNKSATKETMTEKVEVKNAQTPGVLSRFLGYALLSLGVILLLVGVVLLVLFYSAPRLDEDMNRPVVSELASATKDEEIEVSGKVKDQDRVIIYVNDKAIDSRVEVDEDGKFEYVYTVDDEGTYKIEVASVEGFPIRYRSEKSKAQEIEFDTTAPSSSVDFDYSENVDTNAFTISGEVEEDVTVSLVKDGKTYSAKADKDGSFEIKDIPVDEGSNKFEVTLRDSAGNKRELSSKVEVTSSAVSATVDINGDGVVDSKDLPEAAGELEAALAFVLGNKLMFSFGVLALVLFALNSGVVAYKLGKQS